MENIKQFEKRIKIAYTADGKFLFSAGEVFSQKLNQINFLIDWFF